MKGSGARKQSHHGRAAVVIFRATVGGTMGGALTRATMTRTFNLEKKLFE